MFALPASPLRKRTLALLCASIALTAFVLVPPAGAGAHGGGLPGFKPTTYLALGDSLAFGYSEAKFNELYPAEPASAYNTGYVDDFGHVLGLLQPGVQTVNDGCPGETTESFIVGPCAYGTEFPLHHPYAGSQLTNALAVIAEHPGQVSPITLDIGANDALGLIESTCKLEAKCIEEHAPALFAHIAGNLGFILGKLRAAAPSAHIIVLGLYNPFGETIPGADALTSKLNELGLGRGRRRRALRGSAAGLQPGGALRTADPVHAHEHLYIPERHPPDDARLCRARRSGPEAVPGVLSLVL